MARARPRATCVARNVLLFADMAKRPKS